MCEFQMEDKSRLLMVIFQSGQDTQMGTVKCEMTAKENLTEKYSNGSNMVQFLTKSSSFSTPKFTKSLKKASKYNDYDMYGIFNGTDSSEVINEVNLPFAIGSASSVDPISDWEFEQALALSRKKKEDDEFRRALEMSKRD